MAEATGFRNINVGEVVATQSLHNGWDPKFEAHIIDEDKVRTTRPSEADACAVSVKHGADKVHTAGL